MRYIGRTHGISVAWLHETFQKSELHLAYELSAWMCADIFTKGFTESEKWKLSCSLICVIDPAELRGLAQKTREIVADPDGLTVETGNKGKGATKCNGPSGHETGGASAVPKKSTPTTYSSSSSTPSPLSTTATTTHVSNRQQR